MPENWAETSRTVDYQMNVEFALNEEAGVLHPLAAQGNHAGSKSAQIEDRFGSLQMREIDARNGTTNNTDIDLTRRWIFKPKRSSVAPLLDPDDQMATGVDLKSPLVTQTADAVRRYKDGQWLKGYYGTARTGEEGASSVPFKAANILAVDYSTAGTPTGLTLNKLIRVRRMASERFAIKKSDLLTCVVTAAQIENLLMINEIRSRDYNPLEKLAALQEGEVHSFMGYNFLKLEIGNQAAYGDAAAVTADGNGYRRVPVFLPSGMHFGTWMDFEGKIDELPGNNHSTQIAAYSCCAATRKHEDKCFQILCLES